ncbi:MAG TPA: CehA/McbA family metallohydrolase [Bryobacteraceae bacterium]|nr:CehA/McbA family metallohydrolase [Bryobacteraceae bacterium]
MKGAVRYRLAGLVAAGAVLVTGWQPDQPPPFYGNIPLGERKHAMGATDPSWSPDGSRILFSLFGSLWTMAADGGAATQVTAAAGYDAGPAWAPDGRLAAFVRGEGPIRGVQLGTQGKLYTVDLETGEERQLAPEMQFIGTPAWARDGRAIYANVARGQEFAIYEIPLQGSPRRVTGVPYSRVSTTVQRGSGWFYSWYPLAVHPSGREIAFGGDRDSTPQLWRMPLSEGLVLASKLTRYAERDQADIQDLCWMNDGTLVFSANRHSQETNFDLWRWTSGGAEPVTRTLYDEYSPRVSPNGKTVLFVSNYLGNPDLFTTSTDFRTARHLKIGPLHFRKGGARLRVRLQDENGNPVAARVSVRGSDGKYYAPPSAFLRSHPGMGDAAGFFHSRAEFELDGPSGGFRVAAWRGIEHVPVAVSMAEGEVTLTLRRRIRWQGQGWWSGEDHIHANYAGPYYLRPEDALLMAEAEDLNVSNLLVANAEGARAYDREFFEGKPNLLSTANHILYWNQEFRNRIVYGHMALLNLTRLIEPAYTSFEGTPHPFDYPSNTMVAGQARQAGGVVAYVHPILGMTRDPFDFTVSAKELPVTAALGLVDVVDIYPWGPVAADIWYSLLNCGFRIAPGAGTDTFANWRSINQVPGNSRTLVRSLNPLSYSEWITGMRAGRSFVTNGPMLDVTVNGIEPGGTVKSASGVALSLKVTARIESPVGIDGVDVLLNGKVVHHWKAAGAQSLTVQWEEPRAPSGWVAVRVSGSADRRALGAAAQAHSAPVYLESEAKAMTPDPESARMFIRWIERLSDLVDQRNNFENNQQRDRVHDIIRQARVRYEGMAKP